MAFKFEELRVWKNALELGVKIRKVTKRMPSEEKYVLASQMNRAVDSISLNIAEGSTGQTDPEFKRFLGIALRSGIEIIGCLHIAIKNDLIDKDDFDALYNETEALIIQIQSLRKSI